MLEPAAHAALTPVKHRDKRSPLIGSVTAARTLAAGITMLSLAGMTVYAGDHLHNATAPLQPAATAVAAPTTTTPTTGRLQLTRTVTTTTARAVTTTHHS
jgi:hypothetical protein